MRCYKMGEEKVHVGEGIVDEAKKVLNEKIKEIITIAIKDFSEKIKEKIPELTDAIGAKIKNLANSQKVVDEIAKEWSAELYEKGLVSKGCSELPDRLLIHNFHQEGYLDGMYVGYILVLMSLIDNEADEKLILSVRDDVELNLIGHRYDGRNKFIDKFKAEKYQTIFKQKNRRSNCLFM